MAAAPLIIGAVALYNWTISPHVGYLHAMQRLQPVMGRMAEELDAIHGTLEEKRSTMRSLQRDLGRTRDGLFTPEESTAFLRSLQALAESTGCTMVGADFTVEEEADRISDPNTPVIAKASHVDLTVTGSYEPIVLLLQTLRERRQKVWVDSCNLNLADPRRGRLECQLGLTIYVVLQSGEHLQ